MWSLVYLSITSTFVTGLKATHAVTAFANRCYQDLIYQAKASVTIPTKEILPNFFAPIEARPS